MSWPVETEVSFEVVTREMKEAFDVWREIQAIKQEIRFDNVGVQSQST